MARVQRSKSASEVDFSVLVPVSLSFGLTRSFCFKLSHNRACFGLSRNRPSCWSSLGDRPVFFEGNGAISKIIPAQLKLLKKVVTGEPWRQKNEQVLSTIQVQWLIFLYK